MTDWDRTHGKARGAYLKAGVNELYVRQGGRGFDDDVWLLYVDGQLEGTANGETTARAAAELAVRCMVAADVPAVTTAAENSNRAA